MKLKSKITGTGSYAPPKVVTNNDLAKLVDTNDAWIVERTGIKERRVTDGESTSDIALKAAERAIEDAGIDKETIDLIVCGTVTPDMSFPSTACFVQKGLGIKSNCAAFDLSAACSGFLYGLDIADKYIKGGGAKTVLVIGVDLFSKIIDWTDRSTCILFGDGAGAVIVQATESESGILSSRIHSEGEKWDFLFCHERFATDETPFGANLKPSDDETPFVHMKGNETFKVAVRTMARACFEALEACNMKAEDVDLLIAHQANLRILQATQSRLKLKDEQVFINLDKYGNTSAASIPLALDEAIKAGRIKEGDNILFVAFGGGLTWGATIIRW